MLIGQTVLYMLSASDVAVINRRRTSTESIRNRLTRNPPEWPAGAQAHVGERALEGELLPMMVTRAMEDEPLRISGHVFLNGTDILWVSSAELIRDRPPQPGEAVAITDYVGFDASRDLHQARGR